MAKKSVSELPDGPADDNGLTPRQLKILSVIKKAVEDQGYPPSMREIGQKAGLSSTASVTYQLQFMLQVKGDSMIDLAICDGDYVVIRSQKSAEKGEIVAAMIDGEATVKTWSKKDGHFWLLPANDDFTPIPADDAQILGKVTAVLRSV
ncbi:MAG: hypothetical protein EBW09_01320 [Actinobacteria bacterium]|nr:hypothetical protein [Actinomycetota bacterium]